MQIEKEEPEILCHSCVYFFQIFEHKAEGSIAIPHCSKGKNLGVGFYFICAQYKMGVNH